MLQKQENKSYTMDKKILKFKNHDNYNCEVTLDNGEKYLVYADWLHNSRINYWKNWQCEAGVNRILVTENFDVFSGECKNDYLGNLFGEFKTLNENFCKRDRCTGCTDDLIVKKYKKK